jgi:hypothetical protein
VPSSAKRAFGFIQGRHLWCLLSLCIVVPARSPLVTVHVIVVFKLYPVLPLFSFPGSLPKAARTELFAQQFFEFVWPDLVNEELSLLIRVVTDMILQFLLVPFRVLIWLLKEGMNCFNREIALVLLI